MVNRPFSRRPLADFLRWYSDGTPEGDADAEREWRDMHEPEDDMKPPPITVPQQPKLKRAQPRDVPARPRPEATTAAQPQKEHDMETTTKPGSSLAAAVFESAGLELTGEERRDLELLNKHNQERHPQRPPRAMPADDPSAELSDRALANVFDLSEHTEPQSDDPSGDLAALALESIK